MDEQKNLLESFKTRLNKQKISELEECLLILHRKKNKKKKELKKVKKAHRTYETPCIMGVSRKKKKEQKSLFK